MSPKDEGPADDPRWTARQRELLAAMGLRLWSPVADGEASASVPASAPMPAPTGIGIVKAAPEGAPATASATAPRPSSTVPAAPPAPVAPPRRPLPAAPAVTAAPRTAAPERAPAVLPEGVARMDWAALREAVAVCTACALCGTRTQSVFGVGHPQARVMVIGEAPGEQEDRQGEPFVGKSGQLLDRMLDALALSRTPTGEAAHDAAHQVFIANVLKCRPPLNRNPTPEEVLQCEPYLRRQVELVQPQLILALGRFAIESVLKTTEAVGRLRGRVHDYAGVPVVVSYHPAYLLRQPLEKARAWEDLCLAREVLARG